MFKIFLMSTTESLSKSLDLTTTYLPIVMMIVVALIVAFGMLALSIFAGPKYPSKAKEYPFECGWLLDSKDTKRKHSIKFYMVAIMFLIFDLEIVFMYPWAITFRQIGLVSLVEMFIFLSILVVGYIYVWKKGILEWD